MYSYRSASLALFLFVCIGWIGIPAHAQQTASILNNTGYDIYYLYISPTSSDEWGDDALGDGIFSTGTSFKVTLNQGCTYDIQAVDEDDDRYEKYNVNLCAQSKQVIDLGDLVANQEATTNPTGMPVTLYNDLDRTIYYVNIVAEGRADWGNGVLGLVDVILANGTFDANVPQDGCVYQLRAEDEDENLYEIHNLNLCDKPAVRITRSDAVSGTPPATTGDALNVRVYNDAENTLYYLHFAPASTGQWSEDMLAESGEDIILSNGNAVISIPKQGCQYDVKGEDSRDFTFTLSGLNFCNTPEVRITNALYDEDRVSSDDIRITVKNSTPNTLYYLYASPAGASQWSDDLLESSNVGVILSSASDPVLVPRDGCRYDLRLEDSLDNTFAKNNLDLCASSFVEITTSDQTSGTTTPTPAQPQQPVFDPTNITVDPVFQQSLNILMVSANGGFKGLIGDMRPDGSTRISKVPLPGSEAVYFVGSEAKGYTFTANMVTNGNADMTYQRLVAQIKAAKHYCGNLTFSENRESNRQSGVFTPASSDPKCAGATLQVLYEGQNVSVRVYTDG